jgi:hypothetical protein
MANMSYCRFRNTLQDLRDCYYNMDDSLTGEEFHAREALVELCKSIGEEFGDLDFKPEEEEEEEFDEED